MPITDLAYQVIKTLEGKVTPSTVQTMIDYGFVEIVNGQVQVAK